MRGGASSAHSRASGNPEQDSAIALAGTTLVADPAGALYWLDEQLLVVADLHLEKGSAFAKRGVLLPPYDTATTLARLARLIERYVPRLVIALGDSFHDGHGPSRMSGDDRAALTLLSAAATGSGSPAITTPIRPTASAGISPTAWRSAR